MTTFYKIRKLINNQTPLPKSINICYNKKYIKIIQAAELLENLYQQLFQLKIIFLNESRS